MLHPCWQQPWCQLFMRGEGLVPAVHGGLAQAEARARRCHLAATSQAPETVSQYLEAACCSSSS